MSITNELFERWKTAKEIDSNRAAMRLLNLSPTANIHWKAGRNADADVIERMAIDLGENPGPLIAKAMAEQAKGPAARTWERLAKQLGAAAVVVLAVALPMVDGVEAKACDIKGLQAVYYVKFRRWVAEKLAGIQQLAMSACSPVAPFHRNNMSCTT